MPQMVKLNVEVRVYVQLYIYSYACIYEAGLPSISVISRTIIACINHFYFFKIMLRDCFYSELKKIFLILEHIISITITAGINHFNFFKIMTRVCLY
jgi:hypothetical protein